MEIWKCGKENLSKNEKAVRGSRKGKMGSCTDARKKNLGAIKKSLDKDSRKTKKSDLPTVNNKNNRDQSLKIMAKGRIDREWHLKEEQ